MEKEVKEKLFEIKQGLKDIGCSKFRMPERVEPMFENCIVAKWVVSYYDLFRVIECKVDGNYVQRNHTRYDIIGIEPNGVEHRRTLTITNV